MQYVSTSTFLTPRFFILLLFVLFSQKYYLQILRNTYENDFLIAIAALLAVSTGLSLEPMKVAFYATNTGDLSEKS